MTFLVVQLITPGDGDVRPRHPNGNVVLPSKDRPTVLYGSSSEAETEAVSLAKQNPQKQYAVMTIHKVYETTDPKVLTKILNESGELVLEKQQ